MNDEYYTRREDIDKELTHYKQHFGGATVYCNCDDPRLSEFSRYFREHFHDLGLAQLISTCYRPHNIELINLHDDYALEPNMQIVNADNWATGGELQTLKGDGDFRSTECIELLKQADVVVSNPPFSLFAEYISLLVRYNKRFLIIGNTLSVTSNAVFPLIQNNKLWFGATPRGMSFNISQSQIDTLLASKKDEGSYSIIDGRMMRAVNATWFTNLDHNHRPEPLLLGKHYARYDNYDAINVDRVNDIPETYDGVMGVPITFLEKYCPQQFTIVGMAENP